MPRLALSTKNTEHLGDVMRNCLIGQGDIILASSSKANSYLRDSDGGNGQCLFFAGPVRHTWQLVWSAGFVRAGLPEPLWNFG